jgi:apolipoprotein N-acyltransferase
LPITKIGWLAMSLYLAVFWVLPALAVRFARAKGLPLFIALPILVAGWERLQGFPMGGFYWRFLGHSQYQNLAMIQIADLLGATGVSFVVAMVNGLIADVAAYRAYAGDDAAAYQLALRHPVAHETHDVGALVDDAPRQPAAEQAGASRD